MADYTIVEEALKRGYTMDEIADNLARDNGVDPADARGRGYTTGEMMKNLGYVKPETSDVARGFVTSFKQLPQLGYGLLAGAGAVAESVAGEGGVSTSMKNFGVKKYQEAGADIEKDSKQSDSLSYSWEQAKQGDFGSLVDWLQYGIGYGGGQAVQALATAGVGSLVGKTVLKGTAENLASKMVAKEALRLGATEEAKRLTAQEISKIAVANVASNIGQTVAIGSQAFGMEGGEIFGDLAQKTVKEGRAATGGELAKAFGATAASGALEFVGDKLGVDVMLGKSKMFKPASSMTGVGGRAARAAVAVPGTVLAEGGTEYLQTGIEEYGKGNEKNFLPFMQSESAQKQALDAAGLGAVGGGGMAMVGGAFSSPQKKDAAPSPSPSISSAQTADDAIAAFQDEVASVTPRGSFGNMDELAGFIEAERSDLGKRRGLLAQQQQEARDMEAEFSGLVKDEQIDQSYRLNDAQRQRDAERAREGGYDLALQQREEQQGRTVEQLAAASEAQGFGDAEPTAMQLAMQRAQQKALDNEFSGLLKQERASLNEMRANVKRVAGVPVEQISTPQLEEIAQSEAHPNTKMAAVAALNDRHDAIQQDRERLMQLREARLERQADQSVQGEQPGAVPDDDNQANVKALTENAAKRQATQLTNQGYPTVAYPHPTQSGMWAIGLAEEAKTANLTQNDAPSRPSASWDEQPAIEVKQPIPRKKPSPDNIAHAIINMGGVSTSLKNDILGDAATRTRPGFFTSNGTTDLGALAARLSGEFGFSQINLNDATDNSGAKQLADLIARAVNGESILNEEAMIRAQEQEQYEQARAEINQQAAELDIRPIRGKRTLEIVQAEINAILAEREAMSRKKQEAQRLLDEVADQELIDAFNLQMQEYHDENAITRDERREESARLSAEESAQGDGDSVDQDSPVAGRASPTEGGRGEAEVTPEFGLVGQTEEEAIAEERARNDAEAKRQREEQDAENKRQADAERDSFNLSGSTLPADEMAARGQEGLSEQKADPIAAVKATLDAAGVTGTDRTSTIAAVRRGDLTPEDVAEAHQPKPAAGPTPLHPDAEFIAKANADFESALSDLGDIVGKSFRHNFTPEQEQKIIPVLTRLFDAAFRKGYYKFKEAGRFVLDTIQEKIGKDVADQITLDHLQGAYIGMAGRYKGQGADSARDVVSVEGKHELQALDYTASITNEGNDHGSDIGSGAGLERNSQDAGSPDILGAESILNGQGPNGNAGGSGISRSGPEGRAHGSVVIPGLEAAPAGERGNIEIYTGSPRVSPGTAGSHVDQRSDLAGVDGSPLEPEAAGVSSELAESGLSQEVAKLKQRQADKSEHKPGIENIRKTLPILLEGQQEDVAKAEDRFAKTDGYGMLFTNGTGTGKTFTGLGIVKRFDMFGKRNTIIVVPNDKIASDWQESGKLLGLDIKRLEDTKSAGDGVVVTTYANFGQNAELARRSWDLIVHDEAHYLAQDKEGTPTLALKTLKAISLHPDGAYDRHAMLYADDIAKMADIQARLKDNIERGKSTSTPASEMDAIDAENDRLVDALNAARKRHAETLQSVKDDVAARQGEVRPRVLFLSATPFAYEKAVDWANGYLFDYNEGMPQDGASGTGGRGYNSGSNRERFFMQHFGYRMRYNKLTQPDAKVDSGLMQRQFNTYLKKSGALSSRMLDVKADYDRRFILVDSAIGSRIDDALQWFETQRKNGNDNPALRELRDAIGEKFDYLSRRYLLEAIKAQEVIPHIQEHLALGRKVVVFHDYKQGGGINPFDIQERYGEGSADFNSAVSSFRAEFGDLINSPLLRSSSPINAFKQAFPNVLLFNGDIPSKQRRLNVEKFQDDASGPQVILVQSAAGKEGISLHDTTGKHQRVLFNLGQPTQPTTAIQQEGRIYRTGQKTDAIFRYLNTGTNWEKWAFATTIAQRASAAENLGMGEHARALKDAFIAGFEESGDYRAGMEGEGKGGKERDRAANSALTEYDRAKAFYFGTQKKNSKTKAQEGADYFATPEPVGLKMMELADIRPGESVLEPSAGHGAIARWAPDSAEKTAIEPSMTLRPRLAMVFDGRILDHDFESLHVSNKYDAIVMNPPFGSGGRTAIDHLAKAATHLREGGRIVALIPTGPSADAKFDKWMYETQEKPTKPLLTHPELGPIFRGDTVTFDAFGAKHDMAVWGIHDTGGAQYAYPKGADLSSAINLIAAKSIKPTGKRTESFSPSKGINLVANIDLPQVTFERAGTKVATRIVVLEKNENAPQQTNRDYSNVTDIGDLFDRMENLSIPGRAKPVEAERNVAVTGGRKSVIEKANADAKAAEEKAQEAGAIAADASEATFTLSGDKIVTNAPATEYTTKAGKKLDGVLVPDEKMAKAVDQFTWKIRGEGKWFVRLRHIERPGVAMFNAKSGSIGNPIDTATLESTITSVIAASPSQWRRDTVVTATLFSELPAPIVEKAKAEGYDAHGRNRDGQKLTGATYDGKVYLVQENITSEIEAEETLLHERIHQILHGNAEDENGKALRQSLGRLYSRIGGKDAIVALAKRIGADMSGPLAALPKVAVRNRPAFLVDEFLAHVEGQRAYEKFPQSVVRAIREFYGEFRDWLRSSKFVKIADAVGVNIGTFTQSDLSWTLKKIRQQQAGTGSKAIRFMTAWHGSPHDHDGLRTPFDRIDETAPANAGVSVSAPTESVRRIQSVADRFKSQFKGTAALDIRVVSTTFDIPARFRPSPFAEGVFHDDAGLVYLVTMNLRNPRGELSESRAWQVLLHESVGHYGLSQMMGDKFAGILKAVKQATLAGRKVSETQSNPLQPGDKDYTTWEAVQLRYPDATDAEIAQEVLARMAETDPGSSIVGYAVAVVRQWVREMARAMGVNVMVSTSELRDLVAKASGYMRRGDNLAEERVPSGLVAASKSAGRLREKDVFGNGSKVQYFDDKRGLFYERQKYPSGRIGWRAGEVIDGMDYWLSDKEFGSMEEAHDAVRGLRISSAMKQKNAEKYGAIPALWSGEAKRVARAIIDAGIGVDRFSASTQSKSKYVYLESGVKVRIADHSLPARYDKADIDYRYGGDINALIAEIKEVEGAPSQSVDPDSIGSLSLGASRNEMQERPAMRADESGSPEEPAQSGGWAGSTDMLTGFGGNGKRGLESRARIIGDSGRQYTPEQQQMFKTVGREANDLNTVEKIKKWANKNWVQGIVDQFAPIKDIDLHAYTLTRLSKGAAGAFEAFMDHGKLSLKDGVYDADTGGGVMQNVFFPLGKETTDFLYWIAGNRAERLAKEGKERLFSPQDIAASKALAHGVADFDYTLSNGQTTRDRTLIYADSLKKFNEYNRNVMDMAEQSGLIDGASRHLWEHEFYVPFYRVMDESDGGVRGMNIKQGVVRQQAFKKLKGGEEGLNDLLANTLMNWAHLIDASAKNRAAKATLDAAQNLGIAQPAGHGEKKTVWYMDGGQKREYSVDDPQLLIALQGLDYAGLRGPIMDILGKTKHMLTLGVTASPFFKIRNLIRDSVQAVGTSDLSYNIAKNLKQGADLTNHERQEYVSALAGGALIRFGTMLEGNEAARTRQLIKKGAKDEHILDNESKVRAFYDKYLEPGIAAYNELGNRGEEINRMALYDQLIKQGKSHAEASLMARDLMDFSLQGSFTTIRFLTQTVPFMNARLQGLYKIGRSAKDEPAKMAIVTGMVALASLALLAAYGDDDDWKKREDWDRNNYWWFKFAGVAFRIPKPFELGAIGTLSERSAELIFDNEMTGKRFKDVVLSVVSDQLSMNPVPQLVKPVIDIYANKDSFTGRPIESMSMEKLAPQYRYSAGTSMVARGASTAIGGALSPVQIDHLVRGYFSWLGAFAVGAADMAVRAASDEPTRPTMDYWKVATGGMVSDIDSSSSRYVSQMYEQAKELEQAYGTWRQLRKEGKIEDAAEYRADHAAELRKYHAIEGIKKAESKLNERIRMIERSNKEPAEKRDLIQQIQKQKDLIARRAF